MRNKELLMALAGVVAAGILEAGLAEKAGWFILPAIFWNGLVRVYVFQMRKRLEKHDMEDATTVAGHSQIMTWGFVVYIALVLFFPENWLGYEKETWYGFFLFSFTAYSLYVVEWIFTRTSNYGKTEGEVEALALADAIAQERDSEVQALKAQLARALEELEDEKRQREKDGMMAKKRIRKERAANHTAAAAQIDKNRTMLESRLRELSHRVEAERAEWEENRAKLVEANRVLKLSLDRMEEQAKEAEASSRKAYAEKVEERKTVEELKGKLARCREGLSGEVENLRTKIGEIEPKAKAYDRISHLLDRPVLHGNRYKYVSTEVAEIIALKGKSEPLMVENGKSEPIPLTEYIQLKTQ